MTNGLTPHEVLTEEPITYTRICEAKTAEDMQILFEAMLLKICAEHGGNPDKWRAVQLSNVGYVAGYYDNATMRRVRDWLCATHPVFG